MTPPIIEYADFARIDMRIGTIIEARTFPEAKKPAYILHIDFWSLGIKKTSAQITVRYSIDQLIGKQVVAVINFPPKQIATIQSECLVLGAIDGDRVTLLSPESPIQNGLRIA